MASARKIMLKSPDGEAFDVDEAVALESQTIKHMIEDDCADNGIPLPNVTSKILFKVIEYCKKHVDAAAKPGERHSGGASADEDLKAWDTDFMKVDQATLFDLILRKNECKGGMMEEWYQKLHNNTSPDDVVICQCLLENIEFTWYNKRTSSKVAYSSCGKSKICSWISRIWVPFAKPAFRCYI